MTTTYGGCSIDVGFVKIRKHEGNTQKSTLNGVLKTPMPFTPPPPCGFMMQAMASDEAEAVLSLGACKDAQAAYTIFVTVVADFKANR